MDIAFHDLQIEQYYHPENFEWEYPVVEIPIEEYDQESEIL